MISPRRLIGYFFTLALLAVAFTGCGILKDVFSFAGSDLFQDKNAMYTIDPEYSVNIAHVNEKWPEDEKKISPAQQEVLKQMGTPSHVHFFWGKDERELIPKSEYFSLKGSGDAELKPRKVTWIYLDKNQEVFFKPGKSEEFDVKDIPAKVRASIESGDPGKINYVSEGKDKMEIWRYLRSGRVYYFRNDLLDHKDTTSLPSVPNYKNY